MTSPFLDAVLCLFDLGSSSLARSSSLSFSFALPQPQRKPGTSYAVLCYSAGLLAYRRCSQFPTSLPLNTSPSHINGGRLQTLSAPSDSFTLAANTETLNHSFEPLLQLSRRLNFHKRYVSSVLCLNAVLYGIRPRFSLVLLVQSLPEKFS